MSRFVRGGRCEAADKCVGDPDCELYGPGHDSEPPAFTGHQPRECGEHRTVGPHRAWCFECSEWCYPAIAQGCKGCRASVLEGIVRLLAADTAPLDREYGDCLLCGETHRHAETCPWRQAREWAAATDG
jgi:hypothetical protein